MNEYWFL